MAIVNLAEVAELDNMIKKILYCGECELIRPDFVPETYPEELQCGCEEDTENEFLFW